MSAAWAAVVISVLIALGAIGRELIRRGQRDGKVDTVLEQLTAIVADHEQRVRDLEHA